MIKNDLFCSYGDYLVKYNYLDKSFNILYKNKIAVKDAKIKNINFGKRKNISIEEYDKIDFTHESLQSKNSLTINFIMINNPLHNIGFNFNVSANQVELLVVSEQDGELEISADAFWGENLNDDTFAMSSIENSSNMRVAIGPATSYIDNMLYDRKTDSAFEFSGGNTVRLNYDWGKGSYSVYLKTGYVGTERKFKFLCKENIQKGSYNIEFKSINKNGVFKKPPVGWMTWYAVGFDACEEKVLENAKWQSENLKQYGADTIWVDWEWYHKDLSGDREDGVCAFSPDKNKYPNGLKYVADEIKKMGLVPALWIGYTNEPCESEYMKNNPEIVLTEAKCWCGKYFYDFSHPKYLNDFLPKALQQVKDWGYQAVKYDTIPDALSMHERHHANMYNPMMTTKRAYREMIKKTRAFLGDDFYMLSCACIRDCDVLWGADVFDAARVGNDIFEWEEFMKEGIKKVMHFYPLHNIVLYNDPDNVILGEKYNTYNQAASRIYFVSMLGMPMTFGDVLSKLSNERVDLIRRCLPIMDIHPMDVKEHVHDGRVLTINLNINMPYENYTVVDVFNLQEKKYYYEIRLGADLYLDDDDYHIFDYTIGEYLGQINKKITLELEPCESRILCIRKKLNRPQIISTSRHITQGAAEISTLNWCEEKKLLKFTADLIKDELYKIVLYVPQEFKIDKTNFEDVKHLEKNICELTILPHDNNKYELEVFFIR